MSAPILSKLDKYSCGSSINLEFQGHNPSLPLKMGGIKTSVTWFDGLSGLHDVMKSYITFFFF